MHAEGGLMNDFTGRVKRDEWHPPNGFRRTVTVAMDTAQYQMDINHMQATKGEDLYGTFNMVMRRKPKVRCPQHAYAQEFLQLHFAVTVGMPCDHWYAVSHDTCSIWSSIFSLCIPSSLSGSQRLDEATPIINLFL